jgi:predicted membrane metal-binding protein
MIVFLAVVVVVWIFSAFFPQWSRSAQSFIVAVLWEHYLAAATLVVFLLVLVLTEVPKWQAACQELTSQERFKAENEARKTLAEIVGGAALLVGLYFTWANLQVTQETTAKNLEIAQNTLRISREGQLADRFTKAIDQLRAVNEKGEKLLESRLGGIYALEQIARISEQDHRRRILSPPRLVGQPCHGSLRQGWPRIFGLC